MREVTEYEQEIFLGARRRASLAWFVAILSLVTAICAVLAVMLLVPLKRTEPYIITVNETTGVAQRLVQLTPTDLAGDKAIIEANIHRYVIDRETYDQFDNAARIEQVMSRSDETAEETLSDLWADPQDNPDHPDRTYGPNVRVVVKITDVSSQPGSNTALVFLERQRLERNQPTVVDRGIASVQFEFKPGEIRTPEAAWNNPLGFRVTSYRLDRQARTEN